MFFRLACSRINQAMLVKTARSDIVASVLDQYADCTEMTGKPLCAIYIVDLQVLYSWSLPWIKVVFAVLSEPC